MAGMNGQSMMKGMMLAGAQQQPQHQTQQHQHQQQRQHQQQQHQQQQPPPSPQQLQHHHQQAQQNAFHQQMLQQQLHNQGFGNSAHGDHQRLLNVGGPSYSIADRQQAPFQAQLQPMTSPTLAQFPGVEGSSAAVQQQQQQQQWLAQQSKGSQQVVQHPMRPVPASPGPSSRPPSRPVLSRPQSRTTINTTGPHPVSSSPVAPSGSPREQSAVERILHLYMHDYCLKHNLLKAANALASETGVRTDEGVPIGHESEKGMLFEWFRTFWESYMHPQGQKPGGVQVGTLPKASQKAAVSSPTHPTRQSWGMRRTETEPSRGYNASTDSAKALLLGSGAVTASPLGTNANAAARFWSGGEASEEQLVQHLTPQSLGRETAAAIKGMGWGGRSVESLSAEERNALANDVRQSQLAQQAAVASIARFMQSSDMEHQTSSLQMQQANAEQQIGMSAQNVLSRQASPMMAQQASPVSAVPSSPTMTFATSQSGPGHGRKSPNQPSSLQNRKKRRSSVNLQGLSHMQSTSSNGQPGMTPSSAISQRSITSQNGGTAHAHTPIDPMRSLEEHQNLAKQLQTQSQQQMQKQANTSPTNGMRSSASSRAQHAQSEASSHATSQLNAQIQQLQQHYHRDGGSQKPGEANQISQLLQLQGKLSQNSRDQEAGPPQGGNAHTRNQRPGMSRSASSQAAFLGPQQNSPPPPPPSSSTSANNGLMGPPTSTANSNVPSGHLLRQQAPPSANGGAPMQGVALTQHQQPSPLMQNQPQLHSPITFAQPFQQSPQLQGQQPAFAVPTSPIQQMHFSMQPNAAGGPFNNMNFSPQQQQHQQFPPANLVHGPPQGGNGFPHGTSPHHPFPTGDPHSLQHSRNALGVMPAPPANAGMQNPFGPSPMNSNPAHHQMMAHQLTSGSPHLDQNWASILSGHM